MPLTFLDVPQRLPERFAPFLFIHLCDLFRVLVFIHTLMLSMVLPLIECLVFLPTTLHEILNELIISPYFKH
jgi:hypothetical protein